MRNSQSRIAIGEIALDVTPTNRYPNIQGRMSEPFQIYPTWPPGNNTEVGATAAKCKTTVEQNSGETTHDVVRAKRASRVVGSCMSICLWKHPFRASNSASTVVRTSWHFVSSGKLMDPLLPVKSASNNKNILLCFLLHNFCKRTLLLSPPVQWTRC